MRCMVALVIFASLVLPTKSATANVLSPADYENFRNLDLKMLSIGDDIYGLATNQPATIDAAMSGVAGTDTADTIDGRVAPALRHRAVRARCSSIRPARNQIQWPVHLSPR